MRNKYRFAAAILALCTTFTHSHATVPSQNLEARFAGTWGIDFADQDRSIRPGDNFYEYQNGSWLTHVQFAPNQKADAYWRDVRLLAPRRLNAIFEGLAANTSVPLNSGEGKAGAFYRSFMDRKTVEAKGLGPLKPELDAIRAIKLKSDLAMFMGRVAGPGTIRMQRMYGATPGWTFFRLDDISQDRANPNRYAIYMGAGGLVLPGREYYLEAQFADLRKAYVAYIARMLTLLEWPDAPVRAQEILDLETRIATVSWTHEQMLDQVKTYTPMQVADLSKFAPGFDWRAFMKGARLDGAKTVVIDAKTAFPEIARIFAQAPIDLLKARQAFGIADQRVSYLNSELMKAAIVFRGDALGNGAFLGAAPLDIRAEKEAEAIIPDIVSALYVSRYSSLEVKANAQGMAERMRDALDAHLQTLSWMSPASRATAREKLKKMRILVGFPDRFDEYGDLTIKSDDLYGNFVRSAAYQWQLLIHRLGTPYDGSRWSIRPEYPSFNYSPTSNTVEIPAALLVSTFFDSRADPAVNYGSAGSIIGAMIACPFFTKQFLSYDRDGQLKPWLSAEESSRFDAIWKRISDQYSKVEVLPGYNLKGDLLADEALGDLAGLEIALDAYHASLNGAPARVLDGYSGDQRFFLGRAQMWRAKFVESFIRSQIATGSNEPPFMRVNGLLPNMDSWYTAFDVKAGEKLFIPPEQRANLW